ncbi:capsular exopolysaccharide biosynthesis protein [Xenococcus sp. PCC 7305]|uniref:GumC family protein n=1 Tax=Xenococcus sp. PCC 7305 TaxID=102125 RepID=UPI0002AC0718|nr:polysaccharide biosynthesis tyrosine autokinase [Xenococcus sp. PCC 7305]ELS00675.1 capsular exopolysaccharide biosynthesis protein [Xenococcus sp. PCC 7305]
MPENSLERTISLSPQNGNGTYLYSMPMIEQNAVLEEDDEGIDLRQLIRVIKHRLRLITLVTIGVTSASILWTVFQEPKYEGSFQLLVEPVTQGKEEDLLAILGQNQEGMDYKTQIEVLQSPIVLNPILEKLAVRYPEIEYEDLIKFRKSPLQIIRVDETKIIEVSYLDGDREKIEFVLDTLAQDYLRYSLEERRAEVNQGIEFVENLLPDIRANVDQLQDKLQKFRQRYNLIDIETQANILSQQQLQIEEQFFAAQLELNETRSLYENLQQQLGKEPDEAIANSYLSESTRYQGLLDELQKIEISLAQESARFSPQNPVIITLEEKKAQLLPLLEKEAFRVLGKNYSEDQDYITSAPSLSSLRSKLDLEYIKAANQQELLKIRESSLATALAELKTSIEQMPVIAREYSDLELELTVATESLTRFLQAQQELQLEAGRQALPWQMIASPKLEEDRVSPNPPLNIALGIMGGLLLGVGAALLAEKLDPVFHSTEEIKEAIPIPLLGIIPTQKDLKPLAEVAENPETLSLPTLQIGGHVIDIKNSPIPTSIVDQKNHQHQRYNASPFLEAFRSLNTNIKLLGSDANINSIVVSSSIPSEGKSTVSSHLAQAASAMGQKVLLIDADLRRPQVHLWTGLENKSGLSNILATGLPVEAAIKQVPHWENLSVITAGDIPPDPTRLLSSVKMQKLMERLKCDRNYDLIIYDTPPILGFADGRILASSTNGVVLVVRMGKTDRSLLKQNLDNLKVSNVPVLGLVANRANHNSNGSSYYSRYYSERK